jgi:hypothetical protein
MSEPIELTEAQAQLIAQINEVLLDKIRPELMRAIGDRQSFESYIMGHVAELHGALRAFLRGDMEAALRLLDEAEAGMRHYRKQLEEQAQAWRDSEETS